MFLGKQGLMHELKEGGLKVDPLHSADAVQAASIDLYLGRDFWVFGVDDWSSQQESGFVLDTKNQDCYRGFRTHEFEILRPGALLLGHTLETIELGPHLIARVEGKSSLGRIGLGVHVTAGFIDPGFSGQVTLEFTSASVPILLEAGMPIAQLSVAHIGERSDSDISYQGKYQNSQGVRPSEFWRNWDDENKKWR